MRRLCICLCCMLPLHAGALEGLFEGPWLEEAQQRIEQHRKSELRVVVTSGGKPVSGARVRIDMLRHAFPFGSAVSAQRLVADDSADGVRYRSMVSRLFNRVVFENDLKWPAWDGQWGDTFSHDITMNAMEWLRARDIDVRGHCLVWPGWKHLPEDLRQHEHSPQVLEKRVNDHIRDEVGALQGKIVEWDVVNETWWNRDLQKILGRDAMVRWFQQARKADPSAKLFINDARIVSFWGLEQDHKDFYFDEVDFLVKAGAPVDGIGLQCHFREASLTPPINALAMLDRFASFGLDLAVTEFDIHCEDPDMQAKYLHDFMHVAFSHPAVTEIVMWGFWEEEIFKKERALYRADGSAKPGGKMYEALVFDRWWTQEKGVTSARGEFGTRGFLGDYRIHVSHHGVSKTVQQSLDREGGTVKVELGP